MDEYAEAALKEDVERLYGGRASFVEAAPVTEQHDDEILWNGTVYVFDLDGHPTAKRVYAWPESADAETGRMEVTTVLQEGSVDSPHHAVQSVLAREQHQVQPLRDEARAYRASAEAKDVPTAKHAGEVHGWLVPLLRGEQWLDLVIVPDGPDVSLLLNPHGDSAGEVTAERLGEHGVSIQGAILAIREAQAALK